MHISPAKRISLTLIASVFAGEALIMLLLDYLPPVSRLSEMLIDASLLTIICMPIFYIFVFRQISSYLNDIQTARDQLKVTSTAFSASEAIMIIDTSANIIRVNDAFQKTTGYSETEVVGKHPSFLKYTRDGDNFQTSMWQELLNKGVWSGETWNQHKNGNIFPAQMTSTAVKNDFGEIVQYICIFSDITTRKNAEAALLHSENLAKQSLEKLKYQKEALDQHAIVAITDVRGRITYANIKFTEISGYSQEELIGQDLFILNSGHHPKGFFKDMYRTLATGKPWHNEVCNRAKNGSLYWVDTTISPFIADDGGPQGYITIHTDITERKLAEKINNHLAYYDGLTELPNRRLLLNLLDQALHANARNGQIGAIISIGLDHFKTINDSMGRDVGDTLLQQVTQRLTNIVQEFGTVARLGGDEFIVVLEELSQDLLEATNYTESMAKQILANLNQPYLLGMNQYHITSSIGSTLFSGDQSGGEEILRQANIAMYEAKNSGRNAQCFFDPKMLEAITSSTSLEIELRKALELQQFQLYYQLQVDSTGQPLGAEALIRWTHPERGMISPFNFIPVAEKTGLILTIGQWVLETACAQLKIWQLNPMTANLMLAVNVSANQFLQADFVEKIKSTVQRHNIDPTRLKLELTESMLADNLKEIISTMTELGEIGIKFSLDDFGTGYSSLQYLKKLPLSQLKIDQSFIRDIATNNSDKAIVLTIIAMAHSLGLDVIAEGVETEDQRTFLINNGCINYQGYLFGRPVPIEAFEALIKANALPFNLKNVTEMAH